MKEAPVTALPTYVLQGWRAIGIGDAVFFEGCLTVPERVMSGRIEYFDRKTQRGVCDAGLVWQVSPDTVYCQDLEDRTAELLFRMECPEAARHV